MRSGEHSYSVPCLPQRGDVPITPALAETGEGRVLASVTSHRISLSFLKTNNSSQNHLQLVSSFRQPISQVERHFMRFVLFHLVFPD